MRTREESLAKDLARYKAANVGYFERVQKDANAIQKLRAALDEQRARVKELERYEDEGNLGRELVRLIREIVGCSRTT